MKHLGARRTSPPKKRAERYFPIRLRLVVPEWGFGMKIAEMGYWLDRNAGRGNYFQGGGNAISGIGKAYFEYTDYFFVDLKTAQAFMDHFGGFLKLAIGSESDRPT